MRSWMYSLGCGLLLAASASGTELRGTIRDADSGELLAARLYIQAESGQWFQAASDGGAAAPYEKQRSPTSIEVHTALSAHPFVADLPPGRYTVTAERGKEYLPATQTINVADQPLEVTLRLKRWIRLDEQGWYSGETHVHRRLDELPVAQLADDLNVALPLTYWVTRSHTPPARGDKNAAPAEAELIRLDATHVIYPRNTEYEIFSVGDRRHTLGAFFALNHRSVFQRGVPPVKPIAEQVRREGGLLELDKHNWPWSMMLVPVMDVDLYELTNNHVWRTEFHFRRFAAAPPAYMQIEQDDRGFTERGWIDFTLQNYYTLLNCGFRLRPTAGTASGVHPVPLGFGRVYVHLPDGFSYEAWMQGLDRGRSFVTTGPLMDLQVDGQRPGHVWQTSGPPVSRRLTGWIANPRPLSRIEIIVNGRVHTRLPAGELKSSVQNGGWRVELDVPLAVPGTHWIAVRCFDEDPRVRIRFAHTAPWFLDVPGQPPRPRRAEIEYLIERVQQELDRNQDVLDETALAEYREALARYRAIARR